MIRTSIPDPEGRSAHLEQPYAGLSPEKVLEAAESVGLDCDGRLFALNSYENRVYQIGTDQGFKVLKFYRANRWSDAQILEEHRFAAELAAAELAVPEAILFDVATLVTFEGFRFAAFPWMGGRAPELDAADSRELLGRALGRLHARGFQRAFEYRVTLGIDRYGIQPRELTLKSELLPEALREPFARASGALLERIEDAFDAIGELAFGRLHGDCHLGNLLWNAQGPIFVDLDDCINGPAIQDLWMLLSGSAAEQRAQWDTLVQGYTQFADFDYRELAILEPLRGLRMLHHAGWVVQRWDDPAFPRAFPWFGEPRYWEQLLRDYLEQIAQIDTPPILSG